MTSTLDVRGGLARGEGLADQAFLVLREAILSHQLIPGERLSVPDIARRLGISRSPVREAVARIQAEGLAEAEPHRGAVVARVEPRALAEIYDIREVLEGLAARLAVTARDERLLPDLERLWTVHREAVAAEDLAGHVEADTGFHQRLREAAGNVRLSEALDRLQGQIRLAMATTAHRGGGMAAALAEHRSILDTLATGDAEAAELVARRHIRRLHDSLLAASDESSEGSTR